MCRLVENENEVSKFYSVKLVEVHVTVVKGKKPYVLHIHCL
jgi:hypothetical protein